MGCAAARQRQCLPPRPSLGGPPGVLVHNSVRGCDLLVAADPQLLVLLLTHATKVAPQPLFKRPPRPPYSSLSRICAIQLVSFISVPRTPSYRNCSSSYGRRCRYSHLSLCSVLSPSIFVTHPSRLEGLAAMQQQMQQQMHAALQPPPPPPPLPKGADRWVIM